jgi:hypothetical protein
MSKQLTKFILALMLGVTVLGYGAYLYFSPLPSPPFPNYVNLKATQLFILYPAGLAVIDISFVFAKFGNVFSSRRLDKP